MPTGSFNLQKMYLYNLTLQRATGIIQAVQGNFSGTKQQEIVIARGKVLEIVKPDPNTGKVHTLLSCEVFGIIRSIISFRLTGGTKGKKTSSSLSRMTLTCTILLDYLVVGSDSGRIVILEYNPTKNVFEKVHQETYGKSGCRRIVPGQYMAIDPKGRAVMISKLYYALFCVLVVVNDELRILSLLSPSEKDMLRYNV